MRGFLSTIKLLDKSDRKLKTTLYKIVRHIDRERRILPPSGHNNQKANIYVLLKRS